MRGRTFLVLALALLSSSVAAQARSGERSSTPTPDSSVPLGVYVACSEAFMHAEVLELTADSFFHYLTTDIPPERTTRGTYQLHGDTLIFTYEIPAVRRSLRDLLVQRGQSAEEVDEELFYPWRMFFERLQGQPVLWRTRRIRERDRGREALNPYAVLVYAGSSSDGPTRDRSCRNLLEPEQPPGRGP